MQIYKHHTAAGHTVEKVCSCLPPIVGASLLTIDCRPRVNWLATVRKRILLGDECISTIVDNKKRGCAVGEQCAAEFELMGSKMRKRICCVSFNHPVTKGERTRLVLLVILLTSSTVQKAV
jgi:hypothetical protein